MQWVSESSSGRLAPTPAPAGHVAPPDPPAVCWFYARGRTGHTRGGPEPPRVPQARARARVFRGKTRPPTAFNAGGEACSAATARGAAFVSPHCRPQITEVHSAAACAASAQSPSAALSGYDGTTLFHHVAYAASYTARSATLQAMPHATPWRRFDKTGQSTPVGRFPRTNQGNPGMRSPSPATP